MLTAFGREDLITQAREAGIHAFLMKPVNASLVFDTIMEVLGIGDMGKPQVFDFAPKTEEIADQLRGARVLVVEDNPINQEVAGEILKSMGIDCRIANNGREALDVLEATEFDAVLMDIQMPEMDGYEATRLIRSDNRFSSIPVIAMTAHAMEGDREKCLDAGMNDHVAKPIDIDELVSRLASWIKLAKRQPIPDAADPEKVEVEPDVELPEDLPGINAQSALKRLRGAKGLFKRLLRDFVKTQADSVQKLRDALAIGDAGLARRLAHTLKGVSGNISAEELFKIATRIDTSLKQGTMADLDQLLDDAERAIDVVVQSIVGLEQEPKESSTICPTVGFDPDKLRAGIVELADLLRKSNMKAEECLDSIREDLICAGFPTEMEKLVGTLEDLDYDEALRILDSIAPSLGIVF
jgi:two-component system, sensor histidine kinase and response regulator